MPRLKTTRCYHFGFLNTNKMKITTYKCDCSECGNETNNIEKAKWLEIGSEDNTLFINNYLKDKHLLSLKKYKYIHFCSSKCLSRYFFDDVAQAE